MAKGAMIGFIMYIVFGLYFINSVFTFVEIPGFVSNIDKWLVVIGGGLLILGGINYLRIGRNIRNIRTL
jgi:hypothetical protein